MIESFGDEQVAAFRRNGFLIIEEAYIAPRTIELLHDRFERLFREEYEDSTNY